ncbi:hypothetical protein BDN72DRAFT_834636 [Pluteus cervinus]|uniref:Uncharacterized protein n=1 Tax=Pluteus cervinus TaxID=181527 RepID=A0ACD3B698_9AGAR|nr:hypothetical protein BDN72DRAFT_834636 [Pluteus cervinus]
MASFYLPSNKTTIVFFPPDGTTGPKGGSPLNDPHIVQVKVRLAKTTQLDRIAYAEAQSDVSQAIQTVLLAHILRPFPRGDTLPGCEHLSDGDIIVEGKGYRLHGSFKPWDSGRTLVLEWGTLRIKPCSDKWNFTFKRLI